MKDFLVGYHVFNTEMPRSLLANSWIWEDRNMERDKYDRDAIIKEMYKKDNTLDGARLSMDCDTEQPATIREYASDRQPLETIEQEKKRLARQLSATITEGEIAIRAIRNVLNRMEIRQKQAYFLMDSINQSSRIQMDQVNELRDFLK